MPGEARVKARAGAVLAALALLSCAQARDRFFAGALGGVSALSADGKSNVGPPTLASSSYKPENGPTIDIFAGTHWNDYLSSEVDYLWNENDAALTSLQAPAAYYRRDFFIRQDSALASMLLYFRARSSWVRPYLSVGTGIVRLRAMPNGAGVAAGLQPPAGFHSSAAALHVAVGIDLRLKRGWAFRYSFAETTGPNAISRRLSPPGGRALANFRNLFGFVKYF
ncbi:MAG: outer membrane beta-barrel protein [Bryobacteraceae bacterium]